MSPISTSFPLVIELREAHRAREQKLHERLFAALERGDQLVGEGDRLVPRAEDRRDFALLREGRKEYGECFHITSSDVRVFTTTRRKFAPEIKDSHLASSKETLRQSNPDQHLKP